MIQRKKKRIILSIIIITVIAIIGTGIAYFVVSNNNNENDEIKKEDIDFSSKRLVVTTNNNEELTETYNAKSARQSYNGSYILKFETEEDTRNAYGKLKNNSQVSDVVVDVNIEINEIDSMLISYQYGSEIIESWGLYTMGLDETQAALNEKTSNEEIVVAVIDSGFDLNLDIVQNNFSDRIDNRYINITDNSKDISDNCKMEDPETGEMVLAGHGTHTGSIVLDTTPDNVKMLPIKVEDDEGKMGLEYLKNAIQYAIDQEVDVINLSLGWEYDSTNIYNVASTREIGEVIQEAIEQDIIVVAAAGNGDAAGNRINAENIYPVSYEGVIGVAALQTNLIQVTGTTLNGDSYNAARNSVAENLSYASFSNYGNMIDFAAPGQYILCLTPESSIFALGKAEPLLSGTSHAAPHIASAAATLKSYNSEWNTDEISKILQYYSEDLGTTGRDDDYGYGYVNFNEFEECGCGTTDCDEIYCFGCASEECLYHVGQVKTLESIAVTTDPTKMIYTEGETFDPAGMIVTATYSNGPTSEVTEYTYSPRGALSTTDTSITISYTEGEITKTTTLGITVNANQQQPGETEQPEEPEEKILESIAVTTDPTKMTYTEGETFDPAGMVVTATYSNGPMSEVTEYTYSPRGALSTTDTSITISYTEGEITKTTALGITVNAKQQEQPERPEQPEQPAEKTLVGLEITTLPTKTTYTEGEVINPTGMVVTAVYSNGDRKIVEDYNCFPITPLTTSNDSITVQYTENGKTVTAKVQIVVNAKGGNNGGNNSGNNGNNNTSTSDKNTIEPQGNIVIDNTVKNDKIAFTGAEDYIIPIIIAVAIIGICTFIKYREYKDI